MVNQVQDSAGLFTLEAAGARNNFQMSNGNLSLP